jgi:hypothetical protein
LVRISTLPALFDLRALNSITYCELRSKLIVRQILAGSGATVTGT